MEAAGRSYFNKIIIRGEAFISNSSRTFIGTLNWDSPDYWSTKSGPDSYWKYFIRLSKDLSRVESGKLMYVNNLDEVLTV